MKIRPIQQVWRSTTCAWVKNSLSAQRLWTIMIKCSSNFFSYMHYLNLLKKNWWIGYGWHTVQLRIGKWYNRHIWIILSLLKISQVGLVLHWVPRLPFDNVEHGTYTSSVDVVVTFAHVREHVYTYGNNFITLFFRDSSVFLCRFYLWLMISEAIYIYIYIRTIPS